MVIFFIKLAFLSEKRSSLVLTDTSADSLTTPGGKIKDRTSHLVGYKQQVVWAGVGPGSSNNKNVSKSLKNVTEERQVR